MRIKEMLNKLKSISWYRIAPWVGAAFGVILFIALAISTYNDTVNKRAQQNGLVTRFPMDTRYFFDLEESDAGIILSWHDNTAVLGEGETKVKLDAVMYPITVKDRALTFTSSDEECATVDNEGNITAIKPGNVEIVVSNEYTGIVAKAYLNIIQPVTGMYVKNSSIDMFITDTGIRVEPVVLPETASNNTIRWYSRDTSIVEVDQTGYLKPVDTGITEVIGTTADGGFTAKCMVNVINEKIKVDKVNILNKESEIKVGERKHILVSVQPSNARNKFINWETSDSSVVAVTKTGVITGIGNGTAVITAKSADGASDSFSVTVSGEGKTPQNTIDIINAGGVKYVAYNMTLDEMAKRQMSTGPVYNDGTKLRDADIERTKRYLDPNEFSRGAYKYQFMDLSKYNGISRDSLARFLAGKGILSGKADVFIQAAKTYNVSELYLVAHACLETGYGTSRLATGVEYNGVRVYNMFGIGAYDSDAVGTGSKMAYQMGWTTPEAAIMGGAEWISENYINSATYRQNTLYKMRWNPDNPGVHLYAGDVSWSVSQALILERIFANFNLPSISYEVPVYEGSVAASIDVN